MAAGVEAAEEEACIVAAPGLSAQKNAGACKCLEEKRFWRDAICPPFFRILFCINGSDMAQQVYGQGPRMLRGGFVPEGLPQLQSLQTNAGPTAERLSEFPKEG
jgi:hypothetical protein